MTVALMIWPDLITNKKSAGMWAHVAEGRRGKVSFDWKARKPNVYVIKNYNLALYKERIVEFFEKSQSLIIVGGMFMG